MRADEPGTPLLFQGQADTLFNLNEAIATYRALKAQGTPVAMLLARAGPLGWHTVRGRAGLRGRAPAGLVRPLPQGP